MNFPSLDFSLHSGWMIHFEELELNYLFLFCFLFLKITCPLSLSIRASTYHNTLFLKSQLIQGPLGKIYLYCEITLKN